MATMMLLTFLCLYNLIFPFQSIIPTVQSEEIFQKFVIAGGSKSFLFSQCLENSRTVEGIVYSIPVSESEKFVRFVPAVEIEFEWTTVFLEDAVDIIACSQKAYELGQYMFKFDGSCKIAFNSSYEPESEQGCSSEKAVYITTKPFNAIDGKVIPFGEYYGCLYSHPLGLQYERSGSYISSVELPPPDTCCPTADKGYCLVSEFSSEMNHCEAEARCKARGIPMASKSFYDDRIRGEDGVEPGLKREPAWISLKKNDDQWLWMPEKEEFPITEFKFEGQDSQLCAVLDIVGNFGEVQVKARNCEDLYDFVYCYDPNSALPQC